jgi:hypothetical protein
MGYRDMKLGNTNMPYAGFTQTVTPVAVIVRCRYCGWSHTESRRQNALARAAKMKAAVSQHDCPIWTTSYCNHAHRLADGVPIEHECYVLPPAALRAERINNFEEATRLLEAAKPMRVHRGVK